MTTEVVVMNTLAVAMAADSALTSYQAGRPKIYKSANKIFALSKSAPVGIMVYGSGEFLQLPWESIIKIYRDDLDSRRHDTIEAYANEFIAFLRRSKRMFPVEAQQHAVFSQAFPIISATYILFEDEVEEILQTTPSLTEAQLKRKFGRFLTKRINNIQSNKLRRGFRRADVKKFMEMYEVPLGAVQDSFFVPGFLTKSISTKLNKVVAEMYCRQVPLPGFTGLVFGGFGEQQYFPCIATCDIFGLFMTKLVRTDLAVHPIDHHRSATIFPFAQADVITTFMDGIDPELRKHLVSTLQTILDRYAESVVNALPSNQQIETDKVRAAMQQINDKLMDFLTSDIARYLHSIHSDPIMSLVSILPKDELAIMAETLVNMTSFKRRFSPEFESVGGPIDVAVVSKGDGFVWIRRKRQLQEGAAPIEF